MYSSKKIHQYVLYNGVCLGQSPIIWGIFDNFCVTFISKLQGKCCSRMHKSGEFLTIFVLLLSLSYRENVVAGCYLFPHPK